MDSIFGIPVSGLMVGLIVALVACLLVVAWAALRQPIIFKLGVRNIPRRKAQTTLIVVGLMLSTLIISAALGTGDTLHYSLTKDSYENLGHVDQLVVPSSEYEAPNADTNTKIDASVLARIESALAGDANVDGIMPILDARVSVVNETKQQADPAINLIGADPSRLLAFGGIKALDGSEIDLGGLAPDGVVLSEEAADELDASIGDKVTVFYEGIPHSLTVAGIAEDSYLSGYRRGREDFLEYPGMVMPLAAVQALTGQENLLSAIAISDEGGVRDGFQKTDAIMDTLRPTLAGTGLGVDAIKRYSVEDGEKIASNFTNIFLVLGLFSIAAGLLLIVLIFTMLAAERRSEMGMARAVGTHRRQLVQQFISEGAGYALIAGLIGSALGVAASIGIANAMKFLFGQYVPIEPHVEPRSMVIAYCLGVVITFATVIVSSWKVSKLNVVAAIRDIPDVETGKRKRGTLVWGVIMFGAGVFMTMAGLNNDTAALFYMGASLIPFGAAQILRFLRVPSRPVLSVVGIYTIALWLLPESTAQKIWGKLDGDMEMFFLSGIFMVTAATILTMQNTDLLLKGVGKLGTLFKGSLPAVRTAVAYPAAARGRTGMTIAMFSLIVFSLVTMATMNENFGGSKDANAGWDVVADAQSTSAIPNLTADLEAAGVDTSGYDATGVTTNPGRYSSEIKLPAGSGWKLWPVIGMDTDFIDNSTIKFQQRAKGYESDDAIIAALRNQPNVAVIDSFAIPQGGLGGGSDSAFELTGLKTGDETFDPITVELAAQDGSVATVTIIGIIDEQVSSLFGMYTNQATVDAIYPRLTSTSYFVSLKDADGSDTAAKAIEAAMLQRGVQVTSIHDQIKDAEKQETGFLYLIEGFMGLGLVVGVAAVGVIAFRSVVERRQQIGVLRALGFQRSLVSLGFMIETGFVVAVGMLTGTVLGVALSRNLLSGSSFATPVEHFRVPWMLILVILVATVAAALSMSWLPSRQAGRIAPAEALRYE
jgi:putative ABC transport system permease protein